MKTLGINEWRKLPVSFAELSLDTTLQCGQSFRWKKLQGEEWTCALQGRVLSLKQDQTHLHYKVTWPSDQSLPPSASSPNHSKLSCDDGSKEEDTESLLHRYFNLGTSSANLYQQWSAADSNFKKRAPKFTGVRILKQDAWETLVSFICSSNNNIARISQMVNNLCLHYGPMVGHVHGQYFHDFPSPEALTGPEVESQLRTLGFGYRAKYLARTATMIVEEKSENWLESLANREPFDASGLDKAESRGRPGYRKAHEELLTLQGVGPKVADCICLMGLGWSEAVPVDTHVWQIAQRDYKFGKGKHKSLTKSTYDAIGDHFRKLWGKEAGWAHSVLFAADLRTFAIRVVEQTDMPKDFSLKEEDTMVSKETVTKKRQAMEDEKAKDELTSDKGIINTTTTKRTRVSVRKPNS